MYEPIIGIGICLKTADDQGQLFPVNQKAAEKCVRQQLA